MGRPTDSPKTQELKFRADNKTAEMLKECSRQLGISQAEVLRRAVHKVYEDLQKEKNK